MLIERPAPACACATAGEHQARAPRRGRRRGRRQATPRATGLPLARLLGIGVAALAAALVSACTVNWGFASHRVVAGDLAAASIGLAPVDPWLGEIAQAPAPVWPARHLARRAAGSAPALPRVAGPRNREPLTVTLAPDLALAGGTRWPRRTLNLAALPSDLEIMPALGPADVGRALSVPLPALRPEAIALPRPAPPKPALPAARLWIPKAKPDRPAAGPAGWLELG